MTRETDPGLSNGNAASDKTEEISLSRFLTQEEISKLEPGGEELLKKWIGVRLKFSRKEINLEKLGRMSKVIFKNDKVFENPVVSETIKKITEEIG